MIHCRADGASVLEKNGMVLGVVGDQAYRGSPAIPIAPGDLLFLYTDGVEEAMSPSREVFGVDRLRAVLAEVREQPADQILARVDAELRAHLGGGAFEDDFTMIAVKIL
jgi:sigma-B regulation protein RsbU (phosphoserine phosphatase)